MVVGEFAKMLNYPFYPNVFLLYFYGCRQFLVTAASEKKWFIFWKVTKTCQTFFFLNAEPTGCIWRWFDFSLPFIDPSWNHHTKRNCFQRLAAISWFLLLCFFLSRLQEQEQALNLSIKEATAKVSPVLVRFCLVCCSPAFSPHAWTSLKTINSKCSVAVH